MVAKIKKYAWMIVLGVAIIVVAGILRDVELAETLKSLLRRKKVEEEVLEIKKKIIVDEAEIEANNEKLVELAEKLKEEQINVKDASDEDIRRFYDEFFNG